MSSLAALLLGAALWLGPPSDAGLAEPVSDPGSEPASEPASEPGSPAPTAEQVTPITVTTRLTPEPAYVGDLLTLEVIVAYPRDHSINLPSGLDFSPLELVAVEAGAVESTGNDLRQRFTITLQQFAVGEASVPSFPVTWIDPHDAVHTYNVPPHRFEISSLLGNEADPQPRGDDPMVSLEYANVRLAEILVAVIAALLLAALLATLLIVWRRRERPVQAPPPTPPHVRALADLDTLAREREQLIAARAYQVFYLRLTEIAKAYLGARFGFEALDRTTEEIQDLFTRGQVRVEPLDPKAVLSFLQDCDLVKFARLSPPDAETVEALQTVREMIEQTRASADEPESPAKPDDSRARANRPQPPAPSDDQGEHEPKPESEAP
jgi:hypothetical protein